MLNHAARLEKAWHTRNLIQWRACLHAAPEEELVRWRLPQSRLPVWMRNGKRLSAVSAWPRGQRLLQEAVLLSSPLTRWLARHTFYPGHPHQKTTYTRTDFMEAWRADLRLAHHVWGKAHKPWIHFLVSTWRAFHHMALHEKEKRFPGLSSPLVHLPTGISLRATLRGDLPPDLYYGLLPGFLRALSASKTLLLFETPGLGGMPLLPKAPLYDAIVAEALYAGLSIRALSRHLPRLGLPYPWSPDRYLRVTLLRKMLATRHPTLIAHVPQEETLPRALQTALVEAKREVWSPTHREQAPSVPFSTLRASYHWWTGLRLKDLTPSLRALHVSSSQKTVRPPFSSTLMSVWVGLHRFYGLKGWLDKVRTLDDTWDTALLPPWFSWFLRCSSGTEHSVTPSTCQAGWEAMRRVSPFWQTETWKARPIWWHALVDPEHWYLAPTFLSEITLSPVKSPISPLTLLCDTALTCTNPLFPAHFRHPLLFNKKRLAPLFNWCWAATDPAYRTPVQQHIGRTLLHRTPQVQWERYGGSAFAQHPPVDILPLIARTDELTEEGLAHFLPPALSSLYYDAISRLNAQRLEAVLSTSSFCAPSSSHAFPVPRRRL